MTTTTGTRTAHDGITHRSVRAFLLADATPTAGNGLVHLFAVSWLADLFGAGDHGVHDDRV